MDDKVLFNSKQPQAQQSPDTKSPHPSPESAGTPQQPISSPPHIPRSSHSIIPLLIRIGVGLGILIIFMIILFTLILPRFQKPQAVTLTYWGLWDDPQIVQRTIADFEKKHPLIKISYVKQDIKQYRERLASRIPGGNGPDIYYFHNSWTPMLGGLLSPLPTDVMAPATFVKTYYPAAQADLLRNGAIYGIPLGFDTLSLFINTDLQKAAGFATPENWDDFVKASTKMTVRDDAKKIKTAGTAMGTIDNIDHSYDIISLLFVQNGVQLANFANYPIQVSQALEYYTKFAKGETQVWDNTLDPSVLAFSRGNVGFYFGYSWDILAIKQLNPNLPFTINPVPSLPDKKITVASYWAAGISVRSKYQKEAYIFLNYLAQKETAQKLYTDAAKVRGFGMPYARVDLADTLKDNALLYPIIKQAPTAVSTYFVSDTFDNGLNTKMNAYLGNAVRSVLDTASPDSATETLIKGVAQVQSEYGR